MGIKGLWIDFNHNQTVQSVPRALERWEKTGRGTLTKVVPGMAPFPRKRKRMRDANSTHLSDPILQQKQPTESKTEESTKLVHLCDLNLHFLQEDGHQDPSSFENLKLKC